MIKAILIKKSDKKNRYYKKALCACDQCNKEFVRSKYVAELHERQYCNKACHSIALKKGNVANKAAEKTCIARYNVTSYMATKEFRQQAEAWSLRVLGVKNPAQSDVIKARAQETLYKNYQVTNPGQSNIIQARVKQTVKSRFGVENVSQAQIVKDKRLTTLKQRYNVINVGQVSVVKNKVKKTMNARYNVNNALQLEKTRVASITEQSHKKRHETMKKNGTYKAQSSTDEDVFYNFLCDNYYSNDIVHIIHINSWNIDFYIKSLDMYIQLDGNYWHGLDRPIEEIKKFKNSRDRVIYYTMLRDIKQNKWFLENNKQLIRITTLEFKKNKNIFFEKLNEFKQRMMTDRAKVL